MKILMRVFRHEVSTEWDSVHEEKSQIHTLMVMNEDCGHGAIGVDMKFYAASKETMAMLPVGKLVEVEIRDVPETTMVAPVAWLTTASLPETQP